jgi:hypothetical protein
VGGHASGLRRLLHADLIVQPPEPDSAVGGPGAVAYLELIARETVVERSELVPETVSREGGFILERGTWVLDADAPLRSRYTIRWRRAAGDWQVVLWRWTLFR